MEGTASSFWLRIRNAFLLAAVYASTSGSIRKTLWQHLSLAADLGIPSCIIGDFNVIVNAQEKKGGARFRWDWKVTDFHNFLNENALCDLGFKGSPYTWSNGPPGKGMKKAG